MLVAGQVDGKAGKGKLLLELRMLKLADEQARVRAMIEKEQEDVQGLSERNYRKFVRNCIRQRIEFIKQVSLVVRFETCIRFAQGKVSILTIERSVAASKPHIICCQNTVLSFQVPQVCAQLHLAVD